LQQISDAGWTIHIPAGTSSAGVRVSHPSTPTEARHQGAAERTHSPPGVHCCMRCCMDCEPHEERWSARASQTAWMDRIADRGWYDDRRERVNRHAIRCGRTASVASHSRMPRSNESPKRKLLLSKAGGDARSTACPARITCSASRSMPAQKSAVRMVQLSTRSCE